MKILIVGGGGREHALAWKMRAIAAGAACVRRSGQRRHGTRSQRCAMCDIAADDIDALLEFAAREEIELTIVGPEGPLVAGIVDRFTAAGLACFGPSRAAARLEGSKAFTKDFLKRHRIPTASYAAFTAASFDPGLHPSATPAAGRKGGWTGRRQGRRDLRDARVGNRGGQRHARRAVSAAPAIPSSSRNSCTARK